MKADIYLLAATVLWGIWGFADKVAVTRMHPVMVQFFSYLPALVYIPLWYFMSRKVENGAAMDRASIPLVIFASVCAMLASYLVFLALRSKPASIAMALTSAYPLVTFLLALVFKMEHFSLAKLAGMLLILGGMVLLSK